MQFDKVLVREDMFATDTLSIVNSVSPDPGKLERGSQFSVYPQRQVLDRRVSWNREGRFKIGCFSRALGVDTDHIELAVDDFPERVAGVRVVQFDMDCLELRSGLRETRFSFRHRGPMHGSPRAVYGRGSY